MIALLRDLLVECNEFLVVFLELAWEVNLSLIENLGYVVQIKAVFVGKCSIYLLDVVTDVVEAFVECGDFFFNRVDELLQNAPFFGLEFEGI
jgi:hypothetical protein